MVEINNSDDLRDWLEDKPRECSVVIASRIALRLLPLSDVKDTIAVKGDLTKIIFYVNLISWGARKFPPHDFARASRAAYAADVNLLEQGLSVELLAKKPLWVDGKSISNDKQWQELKGNLLALNEGWEVWTGWYEDILAGRNWAGLSDDLVEQLTVKVANQSDDWWEQGAGLINADIKQWLDEVKPTELSVDDFLQKAKDTVSPRPIINDKNQLDVTSDTEINDPIVEAGLELLPERARRQIKNLLKALERKNSTPPILISSLEGYLEELGKGFDFEITYLDDDMTIIRAEQNADSDKIWCDAGIETAINTISDIHDKIQKHYPLDLKRDEYIKNAPIDSKIFDSVDYKELMEKLVIDAEIAYEKGEVTENYLKEVKIKKRQYDDIATLNTAPLKMGKEDPLEEPKKRSVFRSVGFFGKTFDVVDKGVKFSNAVAKLMELIEKLVS